MTPAEELSKKLASSKATHRKRTWRTTLLSRRIALGLSQRDVAKAIGVSDASICLAEKGIDLRLGSAMALAKFFGCTVEQLWTERLPKGS